MCKIKSYPLQESTYDLEDKMICPCQEESDDVGRRDRNCLRDIYGCGGLCCNHKLPGH